MQTESKLIPLLEILANYFGGHEKLAKELFMSRSTLYKRNNKLNFSKLELERINDLVEEMVEDIEARSKID